MDEYAEDIHEYEEDLMYCQWHPKVETTLRCYQCDTPICTKCAQRTPVGYLCPNCKRGRKQRYNQARTTDYMIAAAVSLILGGLTGWFLPPLGWFTVFLSPLAGGLIAELVWRLVGRRYGQNLWLIVAGGIVVGVLPLFLLSLLGAFIGLAEGYVWGAIGLIWPVVHVAMAVGSATARLRLQ